MSKLTRNEIVEKPKCRGCNQELEGSPYYKGGSAYHPITKERAKACHYGGWVCSEGCDYRACLELERSMPGHNGQRSLDGQVLRDLREKWS